MNDKYLITMHSQKGGVGKSILGLYLAHALARKHRTVFIDADLTGTSIADAISVRPPKGKGGYMSVYEYRTQLATKREMSTDSRSTDAHHPQGEQVRTLNDCLFADPHVFKQLFAGKGQHQAWSPEKLLWVWDELDTGEDNSERLPDTKLDEDRLRVIPSSSERRDVREAMRYIYREDITGLMENRLRMLLNWLYFETENPFSCIIIDTPAVLAGLSRAVLPLHGDLFRCRTTNTQPRSGTPPLGTALFVCSPDRQDQVGLLRSLEGLIRAKDKTERNNRPQHSEYYIVTNKVISSPKGIMERARELHPNCEICEKHETAEKGCNTGVFHSVQQNDILSQFFEGKHEGQFKNSFQDVDKLLKLCKELKLCKDRER